MSEPYEKAIEETAKATGKALDLVRDAGSPIADAYGLLIGDKVRAARHRNLDAITRKTRAILKERDLAEAAEVAEQIAIPLLEAAQGEPRSEMQDLWARLLANAMDPTRRDDVRPEFILTLKRLHPVDVLVLNSLRELVKPNKLITKDIVISALKMRSSSIVVSLNNLQSESILTYHNGYYNISDYGQELLNGCAA